MGHLGMKEYAQPNRFLVILKTDGNHVVIPRYAIYELLGGKKGELYLLVTSDHPIRYLPCAVTDLKQEISSDDTDQLPITELKDVNPDSFLAKNIAKYYRVTADHISPKFAISMSALRAHFEKLMSFEAAMFCKSV